MYACRDSRKNNLFPPFKSSRQMQFAGGALDFRSCSNANEIDMKIETWAVHAGHTIDSATGAVSAPIHLSTTFERDVEGSYSRGFMYTRNNNPNREALERGLSAIEGGETAAAFGTGTAAAMALFQALLPGDHVLAHVDAYYGTS